MASDSRSEEKTMMQRRVSELITSRAPKWTASSILARKNQKETQ